MKTAVAYIRTATATALDSVEIQRRSINEFAAEHGYQIEKVFEDIGWSGLNLDRMGLGYMMVYLRSHDVDAVLVYEPERLSRDVADVAKLRKDFERLGAATVFTAGPADIDPTVILMERLGDAFTQTMANRIKMIMGDDMDALVEALEAAEGQDTITLPRRIVTKMHALLTEIVED